MTGKLPVFLTAFCGQSPCCRCELAARASGCRRTRCESSVPTKIRCDRIHGDEVYKRHHTWRNNYSAIQKKFFGENFSSWSLRD